MISEIMLWALIIVTLIAVILAIFSSINNYGLSKDKGLWFRDSSRMVSGDDHWVEPGFTKSVSQDVRNEILMGTSYRHGVVWDAKKKRYVAQRKSLKQKGRNRMALTT